MYAYAAIRTTIGSRLRSLEVLVGRADKRTVFARLRSEQGFGLIELMISLIVLNIGILAVLASFNSGAFALQRASQVSSASVLADTQMELYRALNWSAITLNSGSVTTACADATYAAELSPCATQVTSACTSSLPQCNPMQTPVIGPDNRSYRIDTYVASQTPTNGRAVKLVTVIVRHSTTLKLLARVTTTFDQSTG